MVARTGSRSRTRLGIAARVRRVAGLLTGVAVLVPGAAWADSNPTIGIRPSGEGASYVQAMVESGADSVHKTLFWDQVQPTRYGPLNWPDQEFQVYEQAGMDVTTIRVTAAPDWAVAGGDCPTSICPPSPNFYHDFYVFMREVAERYGPTGTHAHIERFILWNEPNSAENWGGRNYLDGTAAEYSDLLVRFSAGAKAGDPSVAIDAGEVAAASPCCDNSTKEWARRFANYNTEKGRNDNYNILTIHPYSEFPGQIAEKIRNYRDLPGVPAAVPTEFGWSRGEPVNQEGAYKCAASETEQRSLFLNSLREIRENTVDVGRVVWFNGVDNKKDKVVECWNSYYGPSGEALRYDNFGLYRREPDGTTENLEPRLIRDAFKAQATSAP